MAREIEIKIKLGSKDLKILRIWLSQNADFKREENQKEHYLNNPQNTFHFTHKKGYRDAEKYFRIREDKDNMAKVNFKIFKIDQERDRSENLDEIEFKVNNLKETLKLFRILGYSEVIKLFKRREIFDYKEFEIVIDDVEGLGFFAEVELKNFPPEIDIREGFKKIRSLLKTIGFKEINEQKRGYISMLWNPDRDFGERRVL